MSDLNGTNYMTIAEYFTSHGYSDAAAAGMTGVIAGESGGNPDSVGSGGGGLIGWTPLSKLPADAITGNQQADLQTQLPLVLDYANTTNPTWPYNGQSPYPDVAPPGGVTVQSLSNLQNATNPTAAADMWSAYWEKPATPYSDVNSQVVNEVYTSLGQAGISGNPGPVTTTTSSVTSTGFLHSFEKVMRPSLGLNPFSDVADAIDMAIVRGGLAIVGLLMVGAGLTIIVGGTLGTVLGMGGRSGSSGPKINSNEEIVGVIDNKKNINPGRGRGYVNKPTKAAVASDAMDAAAVA